MALCTGRTSFQYFTGKWDRLSSSACSGTCRIGTCQPLQPELILGNKELEEAHKEILEILKEPKEEALVATRCTCR